MQVIEHEGGWKEQDSGNIFTAKMRYTLEEATAAFELLADCKTCTDCRDCTFCEGCVDCTNCHSCNFCENCERCSGCSYCGYCKDSQACESSNRLEHCSACSSCNDCQHCSSCIVCNRCYLCHDSQRCSDNRACVGCIEANNCDRCLTIVAGSNLTLYSYDAKTSESQRVLLDEQIPTIPDIHARVCEATSIPNRLRMSDWHHECGSAHCRAGWVTVIGGAKAATLERAVGTGFAAFLIYLKSCPEVPVKYSKFFQFSDRTALDDIGLCAQQEKALKAGTNAGDN